MFSRGNWSNAAARARSRRGRLLDRTRIRQLIKQQPDAIAASIGDAGYRQDIDLYAHRLDGAELVEAGLSHNLDREYIRCSSSVKVNFPTSSGYGQLRLTTIRQNPC